MNINEIIEFIKSNPEIEIKIDGFEEMDGYFQLSSDVESESIKHSELGDGYNGEILTVETDKEGNQIVEFHPEFKERSVHLSLTGEPHENFFPNLKKPIYQDYYHIWASAIIVNKDIVYHLNKFVEDDVDNGNEDLHYFVQEYVSAELGCHIDDVIFGLDTFNEKGGIARKVGVDDEFSWEFSDYTKYGEINISGYLNNKKVF